MADMIRAIQTGRDHRCNERLAYHVLDLMHAFHDASDQHTQIQISSTCERPAIMPLGPARRRTGLKSDHPALLLLRRGILFELFAQERHFADPKLTI